MAEPITITVAVVGGLTVLNTGVKPLMSRLGLPPSVAWMVLGLALAAGNQAVEILSPDTSWILEFLAGVGVVFLLFRVGLESELGGLLEQLRRASVVWVLDVAVSGLLGYAASRYILNLELTPSVLIGAAFTATSVGVSVGAWQDTGSLDSPPGRLLVDVAELDDISAVILLGLLFALLPAMEHGGDGLAGVILSQGAIFLVKMTVFAALCWLFAAYVEKPLTRFVLKLETKPDPMITVVSLGLLIAALAGALGFSLAIGAFFAGLIFSRDPQAVKMESSFIPLYDLFAPFFFIGLGLKLDPSGLTAAVGLGLVLSAAAIVSKVLANGLPSLYWFGPTGAILIGASMVPRAEIAMIIAKKGLETGALSNQVYGGLITVSAVTCILSPPVVKKMIAAWPPGGIGKE